MKYNYLISHTSVVNTIESCFELQLIKPLYTIIKHIVWLKVELGCIRSLKLIYSILNIIDLLHSGSAGEGDGRKEESA